MFHFPSHFSWIWKFMDMVSGHATDIPGYSCCTESFKEEDFRVQAGIWGFSLIPKIPLLLSWAEIPFPNPAPNPTFSSLDMVVSLWNSWKYPEAG